MLSDLLSVGRRSRLWDALVEKRRLATWVDASQEGSRLSGQFLAQVEAAPGVKPSAIESAIFETIAELIDGGPSEVEMTRSRARLEAAWRWEQEDMGGLASGLGQYALQGDWRDWQAEHREALATTSAEVRRVADAYLNQVGLTAGWSVPKGLERGKVVATGSVPEAVLLPFRGTMSRQTETVATGPSHPAGSASAPTVWAVPSAAARLVDYRPKRSRLANGLRVISERRPGSGVIVLELECDSGALREAKPGLAYLTGRLREEGTDRLTAEELAEAVEDIGGQLDVHPTGLTLKARAEDLETAFGLLADLAIRPAFPAESLSWTRRKIAAEVRADRDDPSYRASLLFLELIYGDHPYGRDSRGSGRQLSGLTVDDVRAHQNRLFVPENAALVVVGDFESADLRDHLRTYFDPWPSTGLRLPELPSSSSSASARSRRVTCPGEQVQILIGHLGIARDDPDYDALVVLDHILGCGPGFTDRLSRRLRDESGLAYSVGGSIAESADRLPGALRIGLATAPENADRAVQEAIAQVVALQRGEFSDLEVEEARRYLAGAWVFDYQTTPQRAERLLELERWGLTLSEPIDWPERVARVDPSSVRAAAARHLHPDRLATVLLGPLGPRRAARPLRGAGR